MRSLEALFKRILGTMKGQFFWIILEAAFSNYVGLWAWGLKREGFIMLHHETEERDHRKPYEYA